MTGSGLANKNHAWFAIVMGIFAGLGLLAVGLSKPGAGSLIIWALVCFGCVAVGIAWLAINRRR